MTASRLLLALMGLALAQVAHAEPIATFTTTLLHAEGQTSLYHGAGQYYDESTGTYSNVWSYTYLPTAMSGTIDGSGTEIRYAGQSKESYFFGSAPVPGSPNDTNAFRLRVEVIDLASGEAGTFHFDVFGGFSHLLPAEMRGEATLDSKSDAYHSFVVGRNRYELNVYGGDTDSNAWLFGSVNVTENVPEPATLAMAGMGLVSALGFRRRLRSASA